MAKKYIRGTLIRTPVKGEGWRTGEEKRKRRRRTRGERVNKFI